MQTHSLLSSVLRGMFAGAAATLVMTRFQDKALARLPVSQNENNPQTEPSTVKVADLALQKILLRKLPENIKPMAGQLVHYSFGTTMGGLFGVLAQLFSWNSGVVSKGLAFGSGLWLVADETLLPALRITKAPWKYPARTHVFGLSSHLVYGSALGLALKPLRR